jgi:signal transduction histidine kinase
MTDQKKQLLEKTHQKFFEVGLSETIPLKTLDAILLDDLTGFGTTADERVFSKSDFYTIIERQRVQSKGLNIKWHIAPLVHRVSKDGNSAVFMDDIILEMDIDGEPIKMDLRSTSVLEFQEDKWLIVHWHGSKPEQVESETDTFGIDQWKQRTMELEKIVTQRTSDLIEKNKELETAILQLKATQSQLIQSEKMASLGELTAGIAHEIQNPLNFVNNFSEVNTELIDEMEEEIKKGDYEEVMAIAKDIKDNQQKINHHGKRADAIVKGMLQHSRKSSSEKEPSNINAIADEYLRLAYHGLRAKDKSFNATMETDFDESVGLVNVVPQDIGRVILNLITNAFYAVNEKAKANSEGYQPTVTVSSKLTPLLGGAGGGSQVVQIAISDNGNGIPKDIVDKIFQPFFTTKPTGQGTGLGLSLSYDIVKVHGGDLRVKSVEGEGTEMMFFLPIV